MPSNLRKYAFNAVRITLIIGGIVFVVGSIHALLTIPPAPSDSDGFATGMAYFVGGFILIVSLGVTGLGFVLPTILGTDDSLGFNHHQRWILKVSGLIFVGGFFINFVIAEEFSKSLEQMAEDALNDAESRAEDADISYERTILEEVPYEAIVEYSAEHDIDCIVIGATGQSGLKEHLLGSTTDRVAQSAATSVLIARA